MSSISNKGPRQQSVGTPRWIFRLVDRTWGKGAKRRAKSVDHPEGLPERWFDPCPFDRPRGYDSLSSSVKWGDRNFINPPFNDIGSFVKRAIKESKKGATSVLLVPLRAHCAWFLELIWGKYEVIPFRGYIVFRGHKHNFPSPMCLIVIGGSKARKCRFIVRPKARRRNGEDTKDGLLVYTR